MAQTQRVQRVADCLQRELAPILQRELSDPRLDFLTVTDVMVAKDLSSARVYVSALSSSDLTQTDASRDYQTTQIDVLSKSTGYIRHLLGQRMQLRIVPTLRFIFDDSAQKANYIGGIIDKAMSETSLIDES